MAHPVDIYVGQRLRHRRWLNGMTQQQLATAVGIKFQQIQKYESGANRISASRLWDLSRALDVPISYFFDGYGDIDANEPMESTIEPSVMSAKETVDLIRAYYSMGETPRRRLLELAKALNGEESQSVLESQRAG